jgi:hypothetical protein
VVYDSRYLARFCHALIRSQTNRHRQR